MSYQEDTIDWQFIHILDEWLDANVSAVYQEETLAQDWARLTKIGEEFGEAVAEFIALTGQNPRKSRSDGPEKFYAEVADTIITAILCLQRHTKNTSETRRIIMERIEYRERMMVLPPREQAVRVWREVP